MDLKKIMRRFSLIAFAFVLLQSCGQKKSDENAESVPAEKAAAEQYYTMEDFQKVKKFNTHMHLNTMQTAIIEQAAADNFRFLDIVDDRPFGITLEEQQKIARAQRKAFPERVVYATTFPTANFDSPKWEEETIAYLKDSFEKGATAVKIWKNVGMSLRDKNGKFVMVDHPRMDPILDYLAKNHITLVAHLGEPKDCWLPLDSMELHRGYFSQHPEYHMYLHPEYPSYEDQINARDHMLEKHPDLTFIGAHLGSLEWSLDELAKRLDKFPNMAVDLARMSNLQLHAKKHWKKTRDFFIKYQDRLTYATDNQINETKDPEKMKERIHESRLRDWQFYVTDDTMTSRSFGEFKGLKLPREVIDKIYRENALRWLSGAKL